MSSRTILDPKDEQALRIAFDAGMALRPDALRALMDANERHIADLEVAILRGECEDDVPVLFLPGRGRRLVH